MYYRSLIVSIAVISFFNGCSSKPVIAIDEVVDLSYAELKHQYYSCTGKGIMSAKKELPWKLYYNFTTQNDSSFIQFKDVLGRRVLFVQAIPDGITIWDMQKNFKYDSSVNMTVPIFEILESYDIAQVLWGEIPSRYDLVNTESVSERELYFVNFKSSATQLGKTLNKVIFSSDSLDSIIEFKILDREYGESNNSLLKGIPANIQYN